MYLRIEKYNVGAGFVACDFYPWHSLSLTVKTKLAIKARECLCMYVYVQLSEVKMSMYYFFLGYIQYHHQYALKAYKQRAISIWRKMCFDLDIVTLRNRKNIYTRINLTTITDDEMKQTTTQKKKLKRTKHFLRSHHRLIRCVSFTEICDDDDDKNERNTRCLAVLNGWFNDA